MGSTPRRTVRLGIIVPSSNTALEPLTQQIVAELNVPGVDVSVHFARFRVTHIALSADADAQFAHDAMLAAAALLADAHVDAIGWSGTSASWLGFAADEALCAAIQRVTGVPATSSVLAMNAILQDQQTAANAPVRLGLVTPYTRDVNEAIANNYAAAGLPVLPARSACASLTDNASFAGVSELQLDGMVAEVVRQGANTVLVMCTNVRAAQRAKHWEESHGIRVLDSVAAVVEGMLQMLRMQPESVQLAWRWGSVFSR